MRKFKRALCSLLAIVMCLGMLPTAAFAADPDSPPYEGDHSGSITVTARDTVTGDLLDGVTFQLEDITAGRFFTYEQKTTTASGSVTWTGLSSGTYRVTQTDVPDDYILETHMKTVYLDTTVQKDYPIEFRNQAEAALYIYRFDPDPATGFKPLAGAQFKVQNTQTQEVFTGTTNDQGYLVIPNIPDGEYLITETKAPDGYNVTPNSRTIKIVAGNDIPYVVEFCGDELSSITIINRDISTLEPIAGSHWKITDADGSTIYNDLVTNSAGLAYAPNLEPGTYVIQQTRVANGYIEELQSTTVEIGYETQKIVETLYNTAYGSVTAYITDSTTGKPLAGCSASLYDEQNKLVAGPTVSNAEGLVVFNNVPDGNYHVVVTAPNGYVMDESSMEVSVIGGSNERLPFTSTQHGGIIIVATDAAYPSTTLPGASFRVYTMSNQLIGTYTTKSDGTVTVPSLETGYYIISEYDAPNGYVMESVTRTVYVEAGKMTEVNFAHRTMPFITVQCFIKGTTTPIADSTVTLYNDSGIAIRTGMTEADGTITFTNLEPGVYTVRYVDAPDGYTITTSSQTVEVSTVKGGLATLYADLHSSIVITKRDQDTSEPLAGAIFQIRDSKGHIVDTVTTGADGTAVTDTLTPGYYTVHEQYAPAGYIPETAAQGVQVENNKTAALSFVNGQKTAIVVYAYDKYGDPIENVSYIIRDGRTGKEVSTILTDAAGVAVSEVLDPGIYTVIETVVPEGYVLENPIESRVIVSTGEASYVRFVHTAQSTIKMETVNVSTGEPVTGAVYQVMKADGDFQANYATDENGEAFTERLEPGMYYVKQIVAPDGYLLNTTTQTITVLKDQVNLAKFFNKQMSRIVIQSVIQGSDFGLAGNTYTVEDSSGKEVFHGTTDTSGLLTTGNLEPGRYTVKQIATAEGYTCVQSSRTVTVTLNDATTVKFENTVNSSIIIQLTDKDDPDKGLAGSKFLVEEVGGKFKTELVTDESGKAVTDVLPSGTYMVHQESAPTGYLLDESYQWATVDTGNNTILHFTNERISGLVIQALEEGSHSGIPGAVFEIYHENGKLVETVTTDTTGVAQVNTLDPDTYLIKEISVPDGFTARTLTQKVTITTNEPSTATFYHTTESALTINKTDSSTGDRLGGATFRVTKDNGDYVGDYTTNDAGQIVIPDLEAGVYVVSETAAPDGYVLDTTPRRVTIKDDQAAVLDVTNDAVSGLRIINTCEQDNRPISGNTFEITTYNGTYVGEYTTNSAGLINVDLEPGKYTVYQTYVRSGYVKNEQVWNFTIDGPEGYTLRVQNQRESGIVVHMVDANTGDGIYGVELEIVDQYNNYVGRYVSDNAGNVYLTDVLDEGRYQVRLLSVPTGYTKDNVPKTIVVKTGETTELTWKLQGEQGQVTIVTYSGEDNAMMNIRRNTKLSGAVYVITDASGRTVQTIQGDINGEAHSGALPLGTYYVQQTVAPMGWQVNAARFAIHVTSVNDNIRVEVYNKAGNYSANIEVHGQATAMAGANLKYWFSNIRNDSTSAMDNFYIHVKIPTDAVRATTFYTGTYNTAATYYLEYKTNMSDYRVLASGLNSRSQYSYDISTRGLGLSAGEYVTDIRMVFPTVVAGFHESMAPTLQCYVLSTVRTGYQAIIRCEVGGLTGGYYSNNMNGGIWGNTTGQVYYPNASGGWSSGASASSGWVTGSGQFTTYIYGYVRNPLPSTLPKTGY